MIKNKLVRASALVAAVTLGVTAILYTVAQVTLVGPRQGPLYMGGMLYASNFGQFKVAPGTIGQYSWKNGSTCQPTLGGVTFNAFTVNVPVNIVDLDNSALNETVTPSAVSISTASCAISIAPTHGHTNYYFTSASGGLYEALQWALGTGSVYVVALTPDFALQGGTTSTITSAVGSTSVSILDERTAVLSSYTWNGSSYSVVAAPTGSVSGQAFGIIPLATGSTAIGGQSHLDDGVSNAGSITSTEDFILPLTSNLATGLMAATANASVTTVTLAQYGGVNDNATDIGPALQLAYNAVVTHGGEVYLGCQSPGCLWANPTTFTWGSPGGQITFRIKGTLNVGSTVTFPGGVTPVGDNGAVPVQFGTGPLAVLNGPAATGTLGTTFTVSTNPVTNPPTTSETFTPSVMTGLFAGTTITVVPHYTGATACVITSVVRASNKVTATMSGICHIPAGVNVTIAGVTDSSFNGTFFETGSEYVPASANVLSWSQTAADASSSGGTASGINEDRIENAICTATTSTTATCDFKYSHDASDVWAITGTVITGLQHSIRDMQFTSNGTALRIYRAGWVDMRNVAVKTGPVDTQQGTEISISQIINIHDSTFGAFGGHQSWSLHLTQQYDIAFGTGDINLDGGTVFAGIKEDLGACCLNLKNVVVEQATRGGVIMDNSNAGSATTYNRLLLDNTGTQDLANGALNQCFYNSFYGGTEAEEGIITGFFAPASTSCIVGDHFQGHVDIKTSNGGQFGLTSPTGFNSSFSSKGILDSEIKGINAGASPAAVPFATLNVPSSPASWTGSCTSTPGALDPWGGTDAGAVTIGGGVGSNILLTYSVTPAAGDVIYYGGWVRSSTGVATAGGQAAAFTLDDGASTHFHFAGPAQSTVDVIGSNFYDAQMAGEGWHPVVAMATIASADGSAGVVRFDIGCSSAKTMYYSHPFMAYAPASLGYSLNDLVRIRRQDFHGIVPSNTPAGVAFTIAPIQAASFAGTGTATFAAGAAAGSSPGTPACTTSHVCDSTTGTISFTTGTSTTTGIMLTVTTGITRTNQVNCTGQVYLAASPYTALPTRMTATTTTIVFNVGSAPTASTAYELVYSGCGGR